MDITAKPLEHTGFGRSFHVGIVKMTEFGVLKKVTHDDEWIYLTNETGQMIKMKKIYVDWLNVLMKAHEYLDKPVVFETGSTSPASTFFRDIYLDSAEIPILDVPDDAGPKAAAQCIIRLVGARREEWRVHILRERLKYRAEEIERQEAAIAVLEKQDYDEIQAATQKLDKQWADWEKNPHIKLLIQGAANHGGMIQNIDRKFMLRLRADVSQKRRIPVTVLGRGEGNYVRVSLPGYDNVECEVGLKQSTQKGTRGEWSICTVKNEIDEWFKYEQKMYPNHKTLKLPLEDIAAAHDELMNTIVKDKLLSQVDPETGTLTFDADGMEVTMAIPQDNLRPTGSK